MAVLASAEMSIAIYVLRPLRHVILLGGAKWGGVPGTCSSIEVDIDAIDMSIG